MGGFAYKVENGRIKTKELRTSFHETVLFALSVVPTSLGHFYFLKPERLKEFHDAVTKPRMVRDNVTHPKSLAALQITNKDLKDTDFFLRLFLKELRRAGKGLDYRIGDLSRQLPRLQRRVT